MRESISDFAARVSRDVGCYFTQNKTNYNLKKNNSNTSGRMGVFAWINERKRSSQYWITTYKCLADNNAIANADKVKTGMHFISAKDDDGRATGIIFYVSYGSTGRDYHKAIGALRTVCQNR